MAEKDDTSPEEEPMAEPIDQGPALRDGGTLNLGICHFCDDGKPASVLASRSDGTGWIAVCDEHTNNAEEQGYTVEEQSKKSEDAKR